MNFSPNRIITDFEKSMITTVRKKVSVYLFICDEPINYFNDFFFLFSASDNYTSRVYISPVSGDVEENEEI
jgi:hypothetical protein